MREAYRLNKSTYFNNIPDQYAFMILYIGKTQPDFETVSKKMNALMAAFLKRQSLTKP